MEFLKIVDGLLLRSALLCGGCCGLLIVAIAVFFWFVSLADKAEKKAKR